MAEIPNISKNLVLCADDFAVHASASLGIIELLAQGRLSATSVMALSPRWAQDAPRLRALRAQVEVGLHLDWTSPFAVAAGHGLPLPAAMLRAALGGFSAAAARQVIERQLDAFEAHWQAPPDFVDGHQHVQQFAGIRLALVQVLSQRYRTGPHAPRPPYVRLSRAPVGLRNAKARLIAAVGAAGLAKLAALHSVPLAPALAGVYGFSGGTSAYGQRMRRWLECLPEGGIIMCHPALAIESGDPIGAARVHEWTYLRSPAFAQALQQTGVRLNRP